MTWRNNSHTRQHVSISNRLPDIPGWVNVSHDMLNISHARKIAVITDLFRSVVVVALSRAKDTGSAKAPVTQEEESISGRKF